VTAPFQQFGTIHAEGEGAQNLIGNSAGRDIIVQSLKIVRGRPPMYLAADEIARRVTAYVAALNYELIVNALKVDHAVILSGPAGCGREITAIAAIRELSPQIPIRRFSLEDEDTSEIAGSERCGYLVHAADGLTGLARCAEVIRARDGYLVIIGEESPPRVDWLASFAIEPPEAIRVYRRWVMTMDLGNWARWDDATLLLEGALPADARRLAGLVLQIARDDLDEGEQHNQVARAYRGWHEELLDWFREHQLPHDRALLVAAAALTPASENSVYAAAAKLAKRLEFDINGAGLAWCPVTELGALLDEQQGSPQVIFHRLGFAEAVLRHTIADYPLARQDLLTWLADLVTESLAGSKPRVWLAGTFADVAAGHGEASCIVETARAWAETDNADPDFNANPAFIALSQTCLHPIVGGRVRRAMYEWSRATRLPQTLKLTIAQVCEVLGQTYPSVALTRLKHLATRGNRQVVQQVEQSARNLVQSGHYPEVLAAVLTWCVPAYEEKLSASQSKQRRRVGATLFLEFARANDKTGAPELLTGAASRPPAGYLAGWRAALDAQMEEGTADLGFNTVVGQWLDAAVHHFPLRSAITSTFVSATGAPYFPPRISYGNKRELTVDQVMSKIARGWYDGGLRSPERREVKEAITVPLTRNGALRLLKMGWISARRWLATRSEHR
jgi:hypothetical protein